MQTTKTHHLAVAAMLGAAAFVLMFLEFPLPMLIPPFVKFDFSDLPELLAAFALGPLWGAAVALLKNLLFILIHGSSSGFVGELCNFLLGAVFSVIAGTIYHCRKSRKGALLASVCGAVGMAVISVPLNYFLVYPVYAVIYTPMENILAAYRAILPSADSLLKCLLIFNLPFTFLKGMADVGISFLIYKPLSPLLHR